MKHVSITWFTGRRTQYQYFGDLESEGQRRCSSTVLVLVLVLLLTLQNPTASNTCSFRLHLSKRWSQMEMTHTCLVCWQVPHDKNIRIYFDQNWIWFEPGLPWKSGSIRLFSKREIKGRGSEKFQRTHNFPSFHLHHIFLIHYFLFNVVQGFWLFPLKNHQVID